MRNDEFEFFSREWGFPPEIMERVRRMTGVEAQERYEMLKDKIVPTIPKQLSPGESPEAIDSAEMQEYYLLQKRLGFM